MAKTVIEAEVKTNIGSVAQEMSFMGVSLGSMKAGFKAVGAAAKASFATMKMAMMSTGIGALLIAMLALKQYFTDNEEGASKLKKITSALGVIFGNLTDILSDLGEKLFAAFRDPKQAVIDLWAAIKKNIVNRFTGLIDSFGALGKVIKSALSLDWDGVKEGAAEFGESMVQTATGVDELFKKATEAVKEFGEQTKKEVLMAIKLEQDRLNLQKFERIASVEKARTERDMMKLRVKARDFEVFSAEERLGFMREANKLAGEQLEKDLHVAREKLRFRVEENTYSKSTQENKDDEAALQVAVFQLERSNFSERKRLKSEEQAIVKEMAAAAATAEKARLASQKLDLKAFTDWNLTRIKDETDEEFKIRIQAAKEQAAAQKLIDTKAAADKKIIDNKAAADKKALDKLVVDTKLETEKMGFAAAKSIGGENAAIQQGIAVAETIYNTQQAMMKAMTLPPPYGQIQAALTGIMGAKAIQTILSTSPSGGSVGGGAVATATPDPQMMSGSFSLGQGQEVQPMQAYVVSDDITNNQNKLAIIRRRATI